MSDLQIELLVRVSDGSFESRLIFPVDTTKEQRDGIVKLWLEGMRGALAVSSPTEPAA